MARKVTPGRDGEAAIRAWLERQEPSVLVDLLIDHARKDGALLSHLTLLSAARSAGEPDLSAFRHAIDNAVYVDDFVSYRESYAYADGVDEAIGDIDRMLKAGHPRAAMELSEHALGGVERAMGSVDDSDGYMGGLLERLEEIHLAACRAARPDPEALAERLFTWQMETEWDTFTDAAVTYAKVLGKNGLAAYRRLAEERWARVPHWGPGERGGDGNRYCITRIMENLAGLSGDLEELIAVKSRDLSTASQHLAIAAVLREHGEHDGALEWAERGAAAFPDGTDPGLRTFLAEEYSRRGGRDRAAEMLWANFADRPILDTYQALHALTSPGGGWPGWRTQALGVLGKEAGPQKGARPAAVSPWNRRDGSELVRVYLWENDPERAWQSAGTFDCSQALWMDLAKTREAEHPGDAIRVYMRFVEPSIEQKNNRAYEQAVALLRRVAALMHQTGQEAAFSKYVGEVRSAHKAKRNLMKLFDKEGWA